MTLTCKDILTKLLEVSALNKTYQTCASSNNLALLYLGKLYNKKYITICSYKKCIVHKNKHILRANRCPTIGMRIMNLNNSVLALTKVHLVYENLQQFMLLKKNEILASCSWFATYLCT